MRLGYSLIDEEAAEGHAVGRGPTTPTGHARAMRRAAELCGEEVLARRLGAPPAQIGLWMRGAALPPDDVFLKLVDIIWDHAMEQQMNAKRDDARRDTDQP